VKTQVKDVPGKANQNRPCAAIIILRLMQQLGNILSNGGEVSLFIHFVYLFLKEEKSTNQSMKREIYERKEKRGERETWDGV
jgi:hypothetical protein